ncbi:tumor necrosis factor ligand superfamily member 14-like [Seriola dumerili]|uniref:Tumor necrosis factor ligand superfamily member 14-like n=1 Tax=Seriola dumerili TaxID=41447 RepID=A0A3B4U0H2_SERDU|nr:tumor necrosis factor ligand superfamily member 14-like [Seriola dumerili]XP_022611369.1 tumor necrosis factor ligand superfamily member 14-like [Seriola dumerili]
MAEGGIATSPQVFVVDSHLNYVSVPSKKRPRWARVGQRFLPLLVGLTVFGLVVQGFLIYNLYKKTESFALYDSHPRYLNLSSPKTSGQLGGAIMPQVGSKERPHPEQIQQRPFAHLMGSDYPAGENNVVQWMHEGGEAIIRNMSYNKGRLLVEKEGYYYLYSKVQLNTGEECSLIQHRVMKDTNAYGESIELMKSKSLRCRTQKSSSAKASDGEDLWNSFLAGIFHLQEGDQIFVTLENIQKMRTGNTDNFMGAFMISP